MCPTTKTKRPNTKSCSSPRHTQKDHIIPSSKQRDRERHGQREKEIVKERERKRERKR